MKRVFLKLSGEALADPKKTEFDEDMMKEVARQVKLSVNTGIQVGIIIGKGNFWRGRISEAIDRTKADQIDILATVINYIYASEVFRSAGMMAQILTLFEYGSMTRLFPKDRVNKYFEKGMVIFFAGGIGHSYSSTDIGIALRAIEMEANCILLVKAIDGVHDSDSRPNPETEKYGTISIQKVIDRQLAVVDLTVSIMYMKHRMPMAVFSLNEKNGVAGAMQGRINGTIVATQ